MASQDVPRIIVAAEEPLYRLLSACGVEWDTQRPVPSIEALWQDLSNGELDLHSSALVFSDSLHAGLSSDAREREATAQAVFTMARHGAPVFVAMWDEARAQEFADLVAAHAAQAGDDPTQLNWHRLPVNAGGRAVLETMRRVVGNMFRWPGEYPSIVDEPLARVEQSVVNFAGQLVTPTADGDTTSDDPFDNPIAQQMRNAADATVEQPVVSEAAPQPSAEPAPPAPAARPSLAELGLPEPDATITPAPPAPPAPPAAPAPAPPAPPAAPAPATTTDRAPESPDVAEIEGNQPEDALALPEPAASRIDPNTGKLVGQLTIAVASSKGGSGKSTTSLMLAAQIAHSSYAAGKPLKVALVDLDTEDAQIGAMIGHVMPTALNIRVQEEWSDEAIRSHMVRANDLGVDCLLAPMRPRSADVVGPEFYKVVIKSLQRQYDVVILDCSVRYLSPLLSQVAFQMSDEILVTTTMVVTAVSGLARMVREMTTPENHGGMGLPRQKIGIVVSQNLPDVGMTRDDILAAGLGVPVVGVIPLATKDVIAATNANAMHKLLVHPAMGPAYHRLATMCMPGKDLPPLLDPHTGTRIKYTPPPKAPARVDPNPLATQSGPQNLNEVPPAAAGPGPRPVAPEPKKRIWQRS